MSYKNYKLADRLPASAFKLKSQMTDAAGSVCRNIAEGFGRGSYKENIQFCRISRGSTIEVRDFIYETYDTNFINEDSFRYYYALNTELERSINGHIGFLKKQLVKYHQA